MKGKLSILCMAVAFVCGILFGSMVDFIPKDSLTMKRLIVAGRNVLRYYDQNKKLPGSLQEIMSATGDNDDSWTKNACGSPIAYSVTNGTVVVLETFEPCGSDPEIRRSFTLEFDVEKCLWRMPNRLESGACHGR